MNREVTGLFNNIAGNIEIYDDGTYGDFCPHLEYGLNSIQPQELVEIYRRIFPQRREGEWVQDEETKELKFITKERVND